MSFGIDCIVAKEIYYDRQAALEYAEKWAFRRNPRFFNFDDFGGDCTNFASQCVYAGCGVMNFTPIFGWYYIDADERTASWTGVEYLYNFLISNTREGPFAALVGKEEIDIGDIVQLGDEGGRYFHSPVVVGKRGGEILVAAYSRDAFNYPLSAYGAARIRYLHIGARKSFI